MATDCRHFEHFLEDSPLSTDSQTTEWQHHCRTCPDCALQAEADALLRGTLGSIPTPDLGFSRDFQSRLDRRIETRTPARALGARIRRLLWAYSFGFATLTLWILLSIEWPASWHANVPLYLVLAAGLTCPLGLPLLDRVLESPPR